MSKAQTDEFGRISYRNYSIEFWSEKYPTKAAGTYSIYNKFNSMYDCKDGFKSVDEAVAYIDRYRA
jgi:hypothetical protein